MPSRLIALVMAAVLAAAPVACLTGCSGPSDAAQTADRTAKGRRFTVPAAYFGDKDESAATKLLQEQGGTDVVRNDDGSYTVTMSDESFSHFCADSLSQTEKVLNSIPRSREFPQVTAVSYNQGLTQVTFTCSKADMGEQGQNAASTAIYVCCLHQTIAGEDLACQVTLVDPTGSTIATYSYPDAN